MSRKYIIHKGQKYVRVDDGNKEKRTLIIESTPEYLDKIETMLFLMQDLGNMGASRKIEVYFDGDGAAHINLLNKRTKKIDDVLDKIDIDKKIAFDFD